ncbi:hypothetical protein [Owenweeksia hongkongensis]|uniref:hypothetical protein n=1 Tax=Owenweeksia hongkongensis TaxID=253245 RepID=UPI003A913388
MGLKGVEHHEEAVLLKLKELQSSAYFNNTSEEELLDTFFSIGTNSMRTANQ